MGSGGMAPCILNLCTRWMWEVRFTSLSLYPRYQLDRRLGAMCTRVFLISVLPYADGFTRRILGQLRKTDCHRSQQQQPWSFPRCPQSTWVPFHSIPFHCVSTFNTQCGINNFCMLADNMVKDNENIHERRTRHTWRRDTWRYDRFCSSGHEHFAPRNGFLIEKLIAPQLLHTRAYP